MKTNYKLCSILLISLLFFVIALSNVSAIEVDSFTDMQSNITAGENIELKNNIVIKDSEVSEFNGGIVINNNVTIDGKGYSVDGNHKVRLFQITSNDVVLTLVNITLKNGKITNANGGAIYSNSDVNLILKGTVKFNNNTASDGSKGRNYGGGGAIHSSGNINIISYGDVYFNNNSVYQGFGGAIFAINNISMTINGNIKFNNNNATGKTYGYLILFEPVGGEGGAIYSKGGFVFINCSGNVSFSYNNAIPLEGSYRNEGGAISSGSGVNISANNVLFLNNIAFNGGGGAISAFDRQYFTYCDVIIISKDGNIEFINNIANRSGGAIIANTVNITKAVFYGNSANGNGSAIYVYDWKNSTLINCFLGLNYKNQTEIEKSNIISNKGTAVAPKWWLLLNIIKPDIIASDINNTFKLVFNQKCNGEKIESIEEIPALILVNLTESSNTIQSQAILYFNFTTNQSTNCIIHVINSYNAEEIINISINVDNSPFSKLAELINNNQSIILQKSYNYYQELDYKLANGIKITRNTTIDGAGYTLDAKNLANIFQVEKGVSLILKNIKLENVLRYSIINNGVLDLTNVSSKAPIYNNGIITSGVKFVVISSSLTPHDSFLVSLRTDNGIPIMVNSLKYFDDQGHYYKSYIYYKGSYVNYVPEGITGHVTFNNVKLNGFTNLTSTGSLDISKYPTVKTKAINIPVKEVIKSTVSKLTTVLKTNTLNLVNNLFKTVMR